MPKGDGKKTEHGIAGEAHDLVYGARAHTYGHPRLDFSIIAAVWTGLLKDKLKDGESLDEYRVAVMMTGLKLARLVKSPGHRDSRIDTIGYMLTMERLDEVEVANPFPEHLMPSEEVYPAPKPKFNPNTGTMPCLNHLAIDEPSFMGYEGAQFDDLTDKPYYTPPAPQPESAMAAYDAAWDAKEAMLRKVPAPMPPQYKPGEAKPASAMLDGQGRDAYFPSGNPKVVAWKDGDPDFSGTCTCGLRPDHPVNGHLYDGQDVEQLRASIRYCKSANNWRR